MLDNKYYTLNYKTGTGNIIIEKKEIPGMTRALKKAIKNTSDPKDWKLLNTILTRIQDLGDAYLVLQEMEDRKN